MTVLIETNRGEAEEPEAKDSEELRDNSVEVGEVAARLNKDGNAIELYRPEVGEKPSNLAPN